MGEIIHPGKKAAGERAASYVENGMKIGLGTGSTAYWAIKKIGEMVEKGLEIRAVATSVQSENLARKWDIPLVNFSEIGRLDVVIDGADEVDENFQLIKGGGGALLREKIIATNSKQMIVVVDESKTVKTLGKFLLPVEVLPFALEWTRAHLEEKCTHLQLRKTDTGAVYKTDNGNPILDCDFYPIKDPAKLHSELNNIPGVVENGLFVHLCDRVVVGYKDGHAEVLEK